MTGVSATTGMKVSIGTAAPSAAIDPTTFGADTYTAINEISDLGSFGDTTKEITFESLSSGRVTKLPGIKDGGDLQVTVGFVATDAGQLAMRTAGNDNVERAFKVELSDKPNASGTNTIYYFRGRVLKVENKLTVNQVAQQIYTISVNTAQIMIPASAGV
jgi:hypothetical protein